MLLKGKFILYSIIKYICIFLEAIIILTLQRILHKSIIYTKIELTNIRTINPKIL